MTRFLLWTIFLVAPLSAYAQVKGKNPDEIATVKVVDSLFREDQFYTSISYNLLQHNAKSLKQFSFSPCFTVGFLRDFSIRKDRHWAIAPGVGYNYTNIKQFVNTNDIFAENAPYPSEDIETRIISHSIEMPVEIRWRNASINSHKFWRIYTGFKTRYVFSADLKVDSPSLNRQADLDDNVNRWQYGAYVSAGYNTWNLHLYYGLNPIFKSGSKLADLNFGFMFYIL